MSEQSAYASVGKRCAFIGLLRREAIYCTGAAKKNRAAQPPEGPDAAVNQGFIQGLGFADT
jgi:hypothetical protein